MNFFVSQAIQDKIKSITPPKPPSHQSLLQEKRGRIFELAKIHGVQSIRVFGSVVRGEAGPDSDLDLLVEMEKGKSLLDLIGFEQDLETELGIPIDILTEGSLSPYIKDDILKEAVPL